MAFYIVKQRFNSWQDTILFIYFFIENGVNSNLCLKLIWILLKVMILYHPKTNLFYFILKGFNRLKGMLATG